MDINENPIELETVMTEGQRKQLASLLDMVMKHGFGEVGIIVNKGQVRFFRPQLSIAALFDENEDGKG